MYALAICSIFKNESHCLKEWIEHYLFHGVQHFYLIDDASEDSSCEVLQEYVNKGVCTVYFANWPRYLGRQRHMYNHFVLPHFLRKEMKWLYIADIDEFLWSPQSVHLPDVLRQCGALSQIQFRQYVFASNGLLVQPASLVRGFTKRWAEEVGTLKYMVNSDYEFTSLNVHFATYAREEDKEGTFLILDSSYFIVNHYMIQSREFWDLVKCTRGDGDEYRVRTLAEFDELDKNEVEDLRLVEQNSRMYLNTT